MYKDKSLGVLINIVVTKILIIKDELVSSSLLSTLETFVDTPIYFFVL